MANRLVGVSMVKNEADIIEASVRHNLRYLDHLIVLDHASSDATPDILHALADEGLPLTLTRLPQSSPSFHQSECITSLAHSAISRHAADYVFPLDADEFLHCASRAHLESTLESSPGEAVSLAWRTYVANDAEGGGHPLQRLRWRVDTVEPPERKIVLPRAALANGDWWLIGPGNHALYRKGESGQSGTNGIPLTGVELAHLPLRSPEQLAAKAMIGWLSFRLVYGDADENKYFSWHWRELYKRILAGKPIDAHDVRRYAIAIYALNRMPDDGDLPVTLVEAPIAEPEPLRYTPATPVDPLRHLLAWSSLLVDRSIGPKPAS